MVASGREDASEMTYARAAFTIPPPLPSLPPPAASRSIYRGRGGSGWGGGLDDRELAEDMVELPETREICMKRIDIGDRAPEFTVTASDGSLRRAFGVPNSLLILPGRVTYVIDCDGIVRHIFNEMFHGKQHMEEALRIARELNGLRRYPTSAATRATVIQNPISVLFRSSLMPQIISRGGVGAGRSALPTAIHAPTARGILRPCPPPLASPPPAASRSSRRGRGGSGWRRRCSSRSP